MDVGEEVPIVETGETLGTTTTPGVPLYTNAGPSRPLNASTMLFIGTDDAVRGKLPTKSASGHKLQIQTFPHGDGFRKFYDQGDSSHVVLLLNRNTTRIAEFDDPLGFFFHRIRLGRVSLVFMGENDQENFAALCELDPNIAAVNKAGRVFFWNELEGTPKQKIDDLTLRIQDNLGLVPAGVQRKAALAPQRKRVLLTEKLAGGPWQLSKLQALLGALALGAVFFSLLCSFPPIDKHATKPVQITVPGAERWTQEQRDTYLAELRRLEKERLELSVDRQRVEAVKRKMIEKINDIEDLEKTINTEKRHIVCTLLDRHNALLQEYTSADHAEKHIAELRRDIIRMEAARARWSPESRDAIELERSIAEKKYDMRVWQEGLNELKKIEQELAGSDVFSWSQLPDYCDLPLIAPAH
jgi:hypothetical protein